MQVPSQPRTPAIKSSNGVLSPRLCWKRVDMKRIIRDRRLTLQEIAKDRQILRLIENEKPEINEAIRQRMSDMVKARNQL